MENIRHSAVITAIAPSQIIVRMNRQAACASCCAKDMCGMGGQQSQTYAIAVDNSADYHIGEEVKLEIQQSNGFWAVFYGYAFPLVLMLTALLLSLWFTQNEIYSGIISIIILIPYYFLLFLMRKYLKAKFVFRITKK